jgi:hypothetical protein
MLDHSASDIYCKLCDYRLTVGDSLIHHIFVYHSQAFVNLLIDVDPQLIVKADRYFEIRPEDWKKNIENNKKLKFVEG